MYKVDKAIIVAAGIGKRMRPLTNEIPKPLVPVNGIPMIDTIINGLKENGITEIYVVVGYLKEKFETWAKTHPEVTLIENPYYETCNNISSLYVAREHLENVIILDGDQIINNNKILSPEFERSGYNCVWTEGETDEWLISVENDIVVSCSRTGGSKGWQLYSISRWNASDGKKLREYVQSEFEQGNRDIYWDDIALFVKPELFKLGIVPMKKEDIKEIDNLEELKMIDSSYEDENKEDIENNYQKKKDNNSRIDWPLTIIPFVVIMILCLFFTIMPEKSNDILGKVRFFFGDTFGVYYLVFGLGILILSLFFAFSKIGNITLGASGEKPKYSFWSWGAMMFTCGLAADILFYSLSEWVLYAAEPHLYEMGTIQEWAGVYPLFHWSFIPWAFYLVLAVAFGYMLHVKNRDKQKFSEACRPLLGNLADRWPGRVIDLFAVFALLAGTATTFSVATPLMATLIENIFHINADRNVITICILVVTCAVYTYSLLHGFKGISILSKVCLTLFFGFLAYVLVLGGHTRYIIETGVTSVGTMMQNFLSLSTYSDSLRTSSFPQNWTIYFWAYWMVWSVAAPFFIGNISRGRKIKDVVLGGYIFGVGSTLVSFIILGNYGMYFQVTDKIDFLAKYMENGDIYDVIMAVVETMPAYKFCMVVILLTMIAFYATSFDSIAYTASCYCYRRLEQTETPAKWIQLLWCILLILLPIALVFSDSSMNSLQSVSIVAAFPLGIIMIVILAGFIKDTKENVK